MGSGVGMINARGQEGPCHNRSQMVWGKVLGLYFLPSGTDVGRMNTAGPLKYSSVLRKEEARGNKTSLWQ